jgi:hypothetical protein
MKSVLRRPVLLLSAAASITVPGVLAILAVLGHQHEDTVASAQSVPIGSQLSQAGAQEALLPVSGRSATGPAPNIRAMIPASVLVGRAACSC